MTHSKNTEQFSSLENYRKLIKNSKLYKIIKEYTFNKITYIRQIFTSNLIFKKKKKFINITYIHTTYPTMNDSQWLFTMCNALSSCKQKQKTKKFTKMYR